MGMPMPSETPGELAPERNQLADDCGPGHAMSITAKLITSGLSKDK